MKNMMKLENGILSVAALGCYGFALTVCGVATYALVMLSMTAFGNLGQGFHLMSSQL